MGRVLRVIGMGLVVLGVLFVLIGMSDDAPGAVLVGLLMFGTSGYALLGSRREDAHREMTDELLRRIAASVDRDTPRD